MELELGREAYARCDWLDAFEAFSAADRETRLGIDDLELAAIAASMAGRMDEYAALLERAHHACLESRETPRAARYAVMLGMNLAVRGELGPAGGWFGRAQRLIERVTEDCAERGWVLVPVAVQRQGRAISRALSTWRQKSLRSASASGITASLPSQRTSRG